MLSIYFFVPPLHKARSQSEQPPLAEEQPTPAEEQAPVPEEQPPRAEEQAQMAEAVPTWPWAAALSWDVPETPATLIYFSYT